MSAITGMADRILAKASIKASPEEMVELKMMRGFILDVEEKLASLQAIHSECEKTMALLTQRATTAEETLTSERARFEQTLMEETAKRVEAESRTNDVEDNGKDDVILEKVNQLIEMELKEDKEEKGESELHKALMKEIVTVRNGINSLVMMGKKEAPQIEWEFIPVRGGDDRIKSVTARRK